MSADPAITATPRLMRILIISDAWHPQVNGVVRTYECIIEELRQRGHTVQVIGPADFPHTAAMPGYPEIRLAVAPYRRLARMIDDFAAESIHIATEGPLGWAARRYCLRKNISFSTCYHTQFPDYVAQRARRYARFLEKPFHVLARFYIRLFHKPAQQIMVATPALRSSLRAQGFQNPMNVFSRGVDIDVFYPGQADAFSSMARPIALYAGRIAVEKNLEDFLKMDWPGSKVVVGDGPMKEILARTYPHVHFTGRQTGMDLADSYRSADVFVFPSRTDTFGIVIVEALACGLPVAAYDVTGPKDIITENYLGALSTEDLREAALRALSCGAAEQRAAHVRRYYTWPQAALQFESALRNVPMTYEDSAKGKGEGSGIE